ncbi:MAG: carbohydrate ABC transporter substrate-binding protein [Anaerolineales bacterium]|nr:carbohydrate ABC transporter substrate-binding protein [Anaerolineales bacterium]
MKNVKTSWPLLSALVVFALIVAACAAPTTTTPGTGTGVNCGGAEGTEVTMLYIWSGAEEESFHAALAPVLDECNITLVAESSRDQALLDTRVASGTPYDIVIWSTTAPLVSYPAELIPLDQVGGDAGNYSDAWRANVAGDWLAVGVKADPKSLVWYSPTNFDALGYSVPSSWADFVALADQMAADGNVPFSMGFESGDATGWTASDFIQDILLATQGPDYVFGLLDGSISYDDAGVAAAYDIYATWATDPAYALGGADGSLSTSFADAILQPFSDPPAAMMVKQSGFAGSIVNEQYPELEYGSDYAFFPFPGAQGVQSGADWLMVFNDTPAVRAIVGYLTSAAGGAHWASIGFGLSPNNGSAGNYGDATSADLAAVLANASAATPDIGDSIQPSFGAAEWRAIVAVVSGASSIADALGGAAAAQQSDLGQ